MRLDDEQGEVQPQHPDDSCVWLSQSNDSESPEIILEPDDPAPVPKSLRQSSPSPRRQPSRAPAKKTANTDEGFLNSGWGTAIFLLGGLGLAVGLVWGLVWITSQINRLAEQANMPGSVSPPAHAPAFQPHPQAQPTPRPLPQEFTDADRARILGSLRTRETDEARLADIRQGFSAEGLSTDPEELRECQAMAEVIQNVFDQHEDYWTANWGRFYHPRMIERIRLLLPEEMRHQQRLALPTQYFAVSLPGIHVLRLRRLDDDQTRVAYCLVGPNVIDPFRFTLYRESGHWKVVDYESIEYGLSFSEVVAMNYVVRTIDPQLASEIDESISNSFQTQSQPTRLQAVERLRLEVIPRIPQPLRDYYRCADYGFSIRINENLQSRFIWQDQIESQQRFGIMEKLLSRKGLSDSCPLKPEEVLLHSDDYMELFDTACPDVMISRAVALANIGRVDESLALWRQVFRMTPNNELNIAALAPLWEKPDLQPALDPLLDEFHLRSHIQA